MSNLLRKYVFNKKTITFLLVIFMVLPMLPAISLPVWGADTVTVWSSDAAAAPIGLSHNGAQIHTSDGWYTAGGVDYPAYCLNPSKPGAGEVGSYSVTMSDNITDTKIYGIVLAGYPYKTIAELGLNDAWEANLATKLALRAYLNGWSVNEYAVYGSDATGAFTRVLAAIKSIYNAGVQNTVIPPAPSVTVTANGGNAMTEDGDNLIKEYTVTSNVAIKSYTVTLPSNAPAGAKITAADGVTAKTTFEAGETFKLVIPKSGVTSSGSVTLDVSGEVANQVIMYGTASNLAWQDYAMTGAPFAFKNANAYATYSSEETTTEPTTPTEPTTTPTEPTTNPTEPTTPVITTETNIPGRMDIIKLEAGTNTPLPGAVFEIRNTTGSIVHVGATDGSGKISLSLVTGYYSVTEITPPAGGYVLDPNPHRDNVLIREGGEL